MAAGEQQPPCCAISTALGLGTRGHASATRHLNTHGTAVLSTWVFSHRQ